jgi:integrase
MPCALGYLRTGDLRAVQDFLGHADPRMAAKYAHVVDTANPDPSVGEGHFFGCRCRF